MPQEQPLKKRGLMSRIRLPRRKSGSKSKPDDKREGTPSPPPGFSVRDASPRKGAAVVTPTNELVPRPKQRKSRVPDVKEVTLDSAPTARQAAFAGPPRYDWIDIVSNYL
jgi:hypothetical protein